MPIAHYFGRPVNSIQKSWKSALETGPGHLLLAMQKLLPEARLVGVDILSAMVAQAIRNLERSRQDHLVDVMTADASALPFADRTFDCVVSAGSLHHWKDPVRALSEAHRVLMAGGHALIYDLVRNMPEGLCKDVCARFGNFRLVLLWLHLCEEPFLNAGVMEASGSRTDFVVEGTRFTGALCCLVLKKTWAVESSGTVFDEN